MDNDKLKDFMQTIPASVRRRIVQLASDVSDHGALRQEARKLLLYDAIYTDVDAEHDLNQPLLSRAVRGCVDHGGRVPEGADREALLHSCPQVLHAIEAAYNMHICSQILDRIEAWAGSRIQAKKSYCSYPIAALGGLTAKQLVSEGRIEDLVAYLDHIETGGYS
jgi:hypothetical protein